MNLSDDSLRILECLEQPAFIADDSLVAYANASAQQIGITVNKPLKELLGEAASHISADNARAFFPVEIQGLQYTVTAAQIDELKLFIMAQSDEYQQLQTLLRAAQQLRVPLASLTSTVNYLKDRQAADSDPETTKLVQKTTKHLLSLQRVIRNMSDASLFLNDRSDKKETTDAAAYIREICEKLIQHFENTAIRITYSGPNDPIVCGIDRSLVDRAIYNMVSNSLKAESKNIHVELSKKGNVLHLSVSDDGCGITEADKSRILSRFSENPVWNMQQYGLGLGMMIVHAAAAAHKGTLLISDIKPHGCKITITMSIEKETLLLKQNPVLIRVDPLGGADQLLLELSDILPSTDF